MKIDKPLRVAKLRIVAIIVLLGMVLGGATWWVEMERIDDRVVNMVIELTRPFAQEHLPDEAAFSQQESVLRAAVLDHFKGAFPIVELYDAKQKKAFEYVSPKSELVEDALKAHPHAFPVGDKPIYERIAIGADTYIQVLLPLQKNGRIYGYFEGVYDVPDETIAYIRANVVDSVLMVWLTIIITSFILYPLLMALNKKLVDASHKVLRGNLELLDVLGGAIAHRDSDTSSHNYRVAWYAVKFAQVTELSPEEMRNLIAGAFLHDVGKIGISDQILLKPGKLTADEVVIMRQHVALGVAIISKAEWLEKARDVVENHHEKWDGSGYPSGVKGESIPLAARIFAIVDVFDALTSKRPYKDAFPIELAVQILREESGKHFDPKLLDIFIVIAAAVFDEVAGYSDAQLEATLADTVEAYYGLQRGRK